MKYLLPGLALVFCASAMADDSGFYSGTSIGRSSVDNPTSTSLNKSTDNVFGGFIGYRINPHFGVEGSYMGIGSFSSDTQSGKADALAVAAVGFAPLSDKFELFGKVGLADSIGKSSRGGLSNDNRFAPTYGIGLQYNASKSISWRLGVDRYASAVKEGAATHNYNSNVVAASFVYHY